MNIKDIAATLAILGSGVLATGCGKEAPATEVPGGDVTAPPATDAEAKCAAGHTEEGHCGGAPEGEASCSADAAPPEGEGEGEAEAAPAE